MAVIDSGIDYSEDIDVCERKNFIPGQDEVSVLYEDSTGHGTCIAGILAAKENDLGITGVNSNIELYSARVLDSSNTSRVSRIIEAINWAVEKEVNILSLSFGTTTDSEALHNAIKKAYENNILIVAAAGNGEQVEYPAAYPETVAVGSVGTDGVVSENSAAGEELELVAPGEQILSTGAFDGVMTCGGTSMAVPHVAGVASLLWEKDTTVDAEFIRMVLGASAKAYDDKQNYGYGLVDYGCAAAMYDECKEIYENRVYDTYSIETLQQEDVLEENETTLETEAYEDVDYVEGRWTTAQHQNLPDQANDTLGIQSQKKLSLTDLSILKLGAVANDNYVARMTPQPQWHGFWKNPYKSEKSNYVACYLYISKIAKNYKNGNISNVSRLSGMTSADYSAMKEIINSNGIRNIVADNNGNLIDKGIVPWKTVLGSADLVTNKNKGLFLYGMALHCATDTFSHSTNRLDGTSIQHDQYVGDKDEKINDAHNQNYLKNRYVCSLRIATKVISNYIASLEGTASDFYIDAYDGSFYLTNISENIQAVDSVCYRNNKSYFDGLNLSRSVSGN